MQKTQGITVLNCIVDFGEKLSATGQVYVAFSRVTRVLCFYEFLCILLFNLRPNRGSEGGREKAE